MPIDKTCEHCGNPFRVKPKDAKRKFCGVDCLRKHEGSFGRPAARVTPLSFTCQQCSKPFEMMQSYVTAYQKKFGKDPMYCSRSCSNLGRRKSADARNIFTCKQCGKEQPLKRGPDGNFYYEAQFCSRACKVETQKQNAMHRFENGKYKKHIKRNGYVWITIPELARIYGKRNIMEHRHVMMQHLGRDLLPEETVHHINGIRSDNRLENLELFNSRHGPGQRVIDKVNFAIEILLQYPEFAKELGYGPPPKLHVSDPLESLPALPSPSA